MKEYIVNLDNYYINKNLTEEKLKNEPGFLLYTNKIFYRRSLIQSKAYIELCINRANFDIFDFERIYDENLSEEEFDEAENKLREILNGLIKKGILKYED